MCLEIRPSKCTLLVPACAENVKVPAVRVRLQRRLCPFFLVGATQLLPTVRPAAGSVNVNVTLAASLRLTENVVPIGGFLLFMELMAGSALPSRQIFAVSLRLESVGVGVWVGVDVGVGWLVGGWDAAVIVTDALLCAADPAWLLAVTWQA